MNNISSNQINIPDLNIDFVRSLPRVSLANRYDLPDYKGLYFACIDSPVFQVLYIGQSSTSLRARWRCHQKIKDLAVVHLSNPVWIHYLLLDWNPIDIEIAEYAAIKKIPCIINTHYNDIKEIIIPVVPEAHAKAIAGNIDKPLREYSIEDLKIILEDLGIYLFDSCRGKAWMLKTISNILFTEESEKQYHLLSEVFNSDNSVLSEFNGINKQQSWITKEILEKVSEIEDLDIVDIQAIDPSRTSSYDGMTIRQMKKVASIFKVIGYSEMTKTELAHGIYNAIQNLNDIISD